MVLPTLLLLIIAAVVILYFRGGADAHGRGERLYVVVALLPVTLSILVPALIGLVWGFGPGSKAWIDRFSWAGVWLSVVLGIVGSVLIGRASSRGAGVGGILSAAVLVAAAPAALLLVSYLLLMILARL